MDHTDEHIKLIDVKNTPFCIRVKKDLKSPTWHFHTRKQVNKTQQLLTKLFLRTAIRVLNTMGTQFVVLKFTRFPIVDTFAISPAHGNLTLSVYLFELQLLLRANGKLIDHTNPFLIKLKIKFVLP